MTRDEIILMAQEANRYANNQTGDSYEWHFIRDERFAALVAAAAKAEEREAIRARGTRAEPPFIDPRGSLGEPIV